MHWRKCRPELNSLNAPHSSEYYAPSSARVDPKVASTVCLKSRINDLYATKDSYVDVGYIVVPMYM